MFVSNNMVNTTKQNKAMDSNHSTCGEGGSCSSPTPFKIDGMASTILKVTVLYVPLREEKRI